jgi:nitrilase
MRIAIIQKAPVFLHREKTIALAVASVEEAVAGGARLIVFPEAFISGYPAWIWRLRPGSDMALAEQLHLALLENAVTLGSDQLAPLCRAAREHKVTVICGLHERDGTTSTMESC